MVDVRDKRTAQPKLKETRVKVRPTVFIGIGGTGKEILLELRRKILNADWNGKRLQDMSEFPVASFLYFDLDQYHAQHDEVAFKNNELHQRQLNLAMYMRDLDRFPLIKEWWPRTTVERLHFDNGPLAIRPISRMHFFSRADELKDIIRQKGEAVMASLPNEQALEAFGLDTQKDLRRDRSVPASADGFLHGREGEGERQRLCGPYGTRILHAR